MSSGWERFTAGLYDVSQTGMYMKNFDALKTDKIIRADKRYAAGLDSQRFKDFAD
jgi:hypothetical protein